MPQLLTNTWVFQNMNMIFRDEEMPAKLCKPDDRPLSVSTRHGSHGSRAALRAHQLPPLMPSPQAQPSHTCGLSPASSCRPACLSFMRLRALKRTMAQTLCLAAPEETNGRWASGLRAASGPRWGRKGHFPAFASTGHTQIHTHTRHIH